MDGSFSWVPDGMDTSTATRIDVRVCAYAEFGDNGTQVWHQTRDKLKVLDRDCVNFKDFSDELDEDIKHGLNQKLLITFWDKVSHSFAEINHDTLLLAAIDMYWDERRLPIMVAVVSKGDSNTSACVQQLATPPNPADKPQLQPTDNEHVSSHSDHESSSSEELPVLDDWVDAEIEYVGVDDEDEYKELLTDSDESNRDDGYDSDESVRDDLAVDDTIGCETIVHVTDFENPKIEVGVTFEDGKSFKKAIRQYAVKGEYEIAAPYSEATRTRRYKGWEEGGSSRRTVTCKRCNQKGHMRKTCNETVLDPNAPPPAPPKPKRVRNRSKKKAIEVHTEEEQNEAPSAHVEAASVVIQSTPSKTSTPAMDISSPMTRSRKRQLDLDSAAIHGMCTPTKQLASTIDINSPMTRSRKKQLGLNATMRKTSKVAAKPKAMKKTTRKLEVKKAKK